MSIGYGTLEHHKRDNGQDHFQIEDSCDYYLITSLLPSNANVCAFACAKSLKLNQEAKFKWISRFETLWLLCWYVSLQTQNPHFATKMIPSTNMRVPRNPKDKTYVVLICWVCGWAGAEKGGCWGASFLIVVDYYFFSFDPIPSSIFASAPNSNLLKCGPSINVETFLFSFSRIVVLLSLVSSTLEDFLFLCPHSLKLLKSPWDLLWNGPYCKVDAKEEIFLLLILHGESSQK